MINAILSILALGSFLLFLFIVAWWIRELDLIIVFIVGGSMAAYDFWRTYRATRENGG